jgi:predicted nucleic acid-binding protein
MRVLYDTSVLVAALVKELREYRRALECLKRHLDNGDECHCSTHALAECYSTFTYLPLQRRISRDEVLKMIEVNLVQKLRILGSS